MRVSCGFTNNVGQAAASAGAVCAAASGVGIRPVVTAYWDTGDRLPAEGPAGSRRHAEGTAGEYVKTFPGVPAFLRRARRR